MVYDPSRPPTPPGQMGITSTGVPQTTQPVGQRPVPPAGPPQFGSQNPWSPENYEMSEGTKAAKAMNPNLNLGPPEFAANGFGVSMPTNGQGMRAGGQWGDQLRGFIDAYKNSIFEWLQARKAGTATGGPPTPDMSGFLGSLFNPPAPASAAQTAPVL